jgi:hypothetical protein
MTITKEYELIGMQKASLGLAKVLKEMCNYAEFLNI